MNEFDNKNLYDETQNNEASEITNISEDTTTTASPIEENITEEASENHIDIDHISNDTDDMHYDYTNSGYSMATPPEPKKRYTYGKSIAAGLAGVILCGSAFGFFLGFGINTSDKLWGTDSTASNGEFHFEENATGVSADSLNLVADSDSISSAVSSVQNSVVNISIKTQSVSYFNQVYESEGAGSGIIYKVDGDIVYILTNCHVIDGASQVTISVTGTEQVSAKLVGKDATADIAVISVSKQDMENAGIQNVTAAKFGNSEDIEVGESVIAIGNALGRGKTATLGIISAENKEVNIDGKKYNVIQTDAAINPGNSGGALINTSGEVIGINTAKLASSEVEGTGYAIPSNTAAEIANGLMENGSVSSAYLGISGTTITDYFKMMYGINTNGVYITRVETGSAAENAGLQASDIITHIDGAAVASIEDLSKAISSHKPNDVIKLTILRNGYTQMEVTATLAEANSNF